MKLDTQLDFAPTLLKHIVHNSLNEVYVFDGETLQFLFVNRGALLNLGYSFDELQHLTPTDIKPEFSLSQFRELVQPLKDGEEEKLTFRTKHKRKDSSTYDVEVHLQYFTENGRSYFFAIILDITDAIARASALNTALAEVKVVSRIKDNFLATMSHDLRTPLNAIIGFSQLMHNSVFGALQNERYKEYVSDILNSANHLLSLVNQILQTSKLEAEGYKISSEMFDPAALSETIINMFADTAREEGKQISLIEDSSAPKFITADPEVAKVIQGSLLSNALRHTGKGGLITLHWFSEDPDTVSLRIEDDGEGFSEDVLESFGASFLAQDALLASKNHKSFGLGLYICKRYVEARGGQLIIGNRENGGAFVEARWTSESIKAEF